jgi:hypothetical protein
MSHGAHSVVFHHSKATGNDLLVLVAIANYISDDGAWPKVETIAKYARTSTRQVHRSLNSLRELGEIDWVTGGGQGQGVYRPNLYQLLLSCPDDCSGDWNHSMRQDVRSRGDMVSGLGVTATADKPVIEPVKEPIRKSTKIPVPFEITEDMHDWFLESKLPVDRFKQTELFMDYYIGTGKTMKDWAAAWRNWMRKAAEYQKTPWDKAKDVAAVESKQKLDVDKEYTRQLLEESQKAAQQATPPPKCQHGESILRCKKCPNGLS